MRVLPRAAPSLQPCGVQVEDDMLIGVTPSLSALLEGGCLGLRV